MQVCSENIAIGVKLRRYKYTHDSVEWSDKIIWLREHSNYWRYGGRPWELPAREWVEHVATRRAVLCRMARYGWVVKGYIWRKAS